MNTGCDIGTGMLCYTADADIAMGSGHFLVGAIDRIESRLSGFLEQRDSKLPRVQQELDRLEQAAMDAFENEDNAPEIGRVAKSSRVQ